MCVNLYTQRKIAVKTWNNDYYIHSKCNYSENKNERIKKSITLKIVNRKKIKKIIATISAIKSGKVSSSYLVWIIKTLRL